MRSRSSSMLGLSVVDGVLFGLLSIPSFGMLIEYMKNGELSVPFPAEACAFIFGPLIVLLLAPVMLLAWSLSDRATTPGSRRAVYVLILLPLVLWAFMFATFEDGLVPSLLVGMPLFVLCAIAIPFSSLVLHRDVMGSLTAPYAARIHCRICAAQLTMGREDQYVQCRMCKTLNANPFHPSQAATAAVPPPPDGGSAAHPDDDG